MLDTECTILLVDPDTRTRGLIGSQLAPLGGTVLHASDGETALRMVNARDIRLVLTELYLAAGEDDDLIHAIRRTRALRRTRTLAHTHRSLASDRDWAMRAGADAYLIKPTRAERLRYVVTRLTTARGPNAVPVTSLGAMLRRDTLEAALVELEGGALPGTSSIVFSRAWWEGLPSAQQTAYRKRAKRAKVSLRSDSLLANHFVEVRGASLVERALSNERQETPYRS
ncbi:MAG: response regulator [Gemmatimonadaceae bacterium]